MMIFSQVFSSSERGRSLIISYASQVNINMPSSRGHCNQKFKKPTRASEVVSEIDLQSEKTETEMAFSVV